MSAEKTDYALDLTCLHCGAKLIHRQGHLGRYRFSCRLDGADTLGSGSECPKNERGHEPTDTDSSRDDPNSGDQTAASTPQTGHHQAIAHVTPQAWLRDHAIDVDPALRIAARMLARLEQAGITTSLVAAALTTDDRDRVLGVAAWSTDEDAAWETALSVLAGPRPGATDESWKLTAAEVEP